MHLSGVVRKTEKDPSGGIRTHRLDAQPFELPRKYRKVLLARTHQQNHREVSMRDIRLVPSINSPLEHVAYSFNCSVLTKVKIIFFFIDKERKFVFYRCVLSFMGVEYKITLKAKITSTFSCWVTWTYWFSVYMLLFNCFQSRFFFGTTIFSIPNGLYHEY